MNLLGVHLHHQYHPLVLTWLTLLNLSVAPLLLATWTVRKHYAGAALARPQEIVAAWTVTVLRWDSSCL